MTLPEGYVRLCRFCGHINPAQEAGRCDNCGSFSGITLVSRSEGERTAWRKRLDFRLNRLVRLALALIPIAGLAVWALWSILDLSPDPPAATTEVSGSVLPQTWSQARRTPQNIGSTPDQAPTPQSMKWTFTSTKPLLSSPAVANGRVFLTTEDGRTLALDLETGATIWEYHTGLPSNSVPALAGDLVYFTLRPGYVVALEQTTGELRWRKKIEDPILASPVVEGGTLYVGAADNRLYALDAATGQERWTFSTVDWITSQVALGASTIILTSQGARVHVIDPKTGRQRLVYDTGRGRGAPGGAVIHGNLVYFGSYGGRVWAIDYRERTYPWDRPILFWKTNFYVWGLLGSPPVQKGSVWSVDLGGDVTGTPAIAHETVYAANNQGKVMALAAATGQERWSTQLESKITAAPTVAGETVLIGTEEGSVLGLNARTGERLWRFQTGGKITGSPIVVGHTIYIASNDGKLYAVTGPVTAPEPSSTYR